VQPGALLTDDDRADVGLGGRFDDRVDRISDEELHAFSLENFRDGRRCLHGLSPRSGSLLEIAPLRDASPSYPTRARRAGRRTYRDSRRSSGNASTKAIERHADEIIEVGETIRRHPELGFKESRTAALVESKLRKLGLARAPGSAMTACAPTSPAVPALDRPSRCSASSTRSW
jgi:hypothetical protein